MRKSKETNQSTSVLNIPEVDIINLDPESDAEEAAADTPKKKFRINFHIIFLLIVAAILFAIYYSITHWGTFVDLKKIFEDGPGECSDTLDSILPLMTDVENPADDGILQIACFGNAPFADDRHSADGLANIIATKANAVVYNCSISTSYLSTLNGAGPDLVNNPLDAYNFYWTTILGTQKAADSFFPTAKETLGDATPSEADEVYETLLSLDFNKIDVVAIMYDASDYLNGNPMYNDNDPNDIATFTGNLQAGISLIQQLYPHIRIIVMSPTYAFSKDKDQNGEYISSDIQTYGWDVLSTYVIKEADSASAQSVTFVDNLYGTITEDNAKDYLTDNLHLNVEGRNLVADRFIYALQYYDEK